MKPHLDLFDSYGNYVMPRGSFMGPPNDFLNILILGDGYFSRSDFQKDRTEVIRTLFKTAPFDKHAKKIKVFSAFTASSATSEAKGTVGSLFQSRFDETTGTLMSLDENKLEKYVKSLSITPLIVEPDKPLEEAYIVEGVSYITNGDTWVDSDSRSFACVGVLLPGDRDGGTARNTYFLSSGGGSRKDLARTFVHELGHALGLGDEYDDEGKNKPNCEDHLYYLGSAFLPNVVSRDDILSKTIAQNVVATVADFDVTKIPWARYLPKDRDGKVVLKYRPHPLRGGTDDLAERSMLANPCQEDVNQYLQSSKWGIGLVEGAYHYRRNIYRSELNCIMRYASPQASIKGTLSNTPFCRVCREWIENRLTATTWPSP